MATRSTREIEKEWFSMLQEKYKDKLPDGVVCHGDRPDFIIRGVRTIGIELAQFYIDDGGDKNCEQRQSELRESTVKEAPEIYLKENKGRKIVVTFSFNEKMPINKSNEVARRIAKFLMCLDETIHGEVKREKFKKIIPELNMVFH